MKSRLSFAPAACAIAFVAALFAPGGRALAIGIDRFVLPLPDLRIEIGPPGPRADDAARSVAVIAGGAVVSPAEEWEALTTGAETLNLRHRDWRDTSFDVDCGSGTVTRVVGDFRATASPRRVVEGGACRQDAQRGMRIVSLPSCSLTYRLSDKRLTTVTGSRFEALSVSRAEGWEVEEAGVSLYRLRRREWPVGESWEVDAARRTAKTADGKRLGVSDGDAQPAGSDLQVEFVAPSASGGTLVRTDPAHRAKPKRLDPRFQALIMKSYEDGVPVLRSSADAPNGKTLPPASRWREREKQAFASALTAEPCDVLLAPFQVEGFALDRVERALLMRYLSDALARATGLRLPNPTLVARALGDGARAIPDEEIFRIANETRARTLITGFVGHDRGERMQITLLVRERRGGAPFNESVEPVRHAWKDIPFSDTRLPSEAFLDILGEVLTRIAPGATIPSTPAIAAREDMVPVPPTLGDAAGGGGKGPVRDAFTLQLLGLLLPDESAVAESFFERSLVALRSVSPESPDYRLLKASALASLHRRPAALAALGTPAAAEEQALAAYLDGDLPNLREKTPAIARALPRLLARIRLNDLEQSYGTDREALSRQRQALVEENPGLGQSLMDRLEQADRWAVPSSIPLKEEFDALFPVAGLRIDELAARFRATGEHPGEEVVDLAILDQYHQALKADLFPAGVSASPVPGDALDVLFAASQRAIEKKVGHAILVQGLPEAGLEVLARYERAYPDHPGLAYIKEAGLGALRRGMGGEAGSRIQEEAITLAQKIFFWSDGQSPAAAKAQRLAPGGPYALPSYDADYPRRPSWRVETIGDRRSLAVFAAVPAVTRLPETTRHELKNALLSLDYTVTDLRILQDLHRKLADLGLRDEARAILEANSGRFRGHPLRPDLLAESETEAAGEDGARRVYEQARADNPLSWDPYFELGRILIGEGDFAGASRMFLSYPPFREPGRGDRVNLSHAAYGAAVELLFRGATEEAIPLLELCAGLESGSGSEMGALAYLAQVRGKYAEAAMLFRDRGNRYRHRGSYGLYIRYLRIVGGHQEADALFDSLRAEPQENGLWDDAVIGLRIAGKTDVEVVDWFRQRSIGRPPFIFVNDGEPLVLAFLVDRGPNDLLKSFLSPREDEAGLHTPWFAEGYRLLKEGRHEDAYRTLLTRFAGPVDDSFPAFRYAMPALAWAGSRSGNADEVAGLLETYRGALGRDFHYHLALALLRGGKGDVAGAVAALRKSWYTLDVNYPPIDFSFPWYQLIEAAEWLHAATPQQPYLDLVLQWSKLCQRIYPTEGWTYAVEALHTPSPEDRTRALTLGLFLDRNSRRLAGSSAAEREAAQAWLAGNNPFPNQGGGRREPNTF